MYQFAIEEIKRKKSFHICQFNWLYFSIYIKDPDSNVTEEEFGFSMYGGNERMILPRAGYAPGYLDPEWELKICEAFLARYDENPQCFYGYLVDLYIQKLRHRAKELEWVKEKTI